MFAAGVISKRLETISVLYNLFILCHPSEILVSLSLLEGFRPVVEIRNYGLDRVSPPAIVNELVNVLATAGAVSLVVL
jgi:hypothetical protein